MKRKSKLLTLIMLVAGAGSVGGVAAAASSPTVLTGATTEISQTSAVLKGQVNPNGVATDYTFSYGPTIAYGGNTSARAAGSGTGPVSVSRTITGLLPGTVYHYRINALNGAGGTVGADRSFTTAGHPPATVITGGPANVGSTVATPTGTINPEGAPTTWRVQYGLTPAYGVETFPLGIAALTTPVPVGIELTGLAPATLFHYRIVAYHGSSVVSAGGDATFFTEPAVPVAPVLRARTSPARETRQPYTFTTAGHLYGGYFIPPAQRCTGYVGIRYYHGHRNVAFVLVPVGGDCRFLASATLPRLHTHGPTALTIKVHFRGNGYLAAAQTTERVTIG